MLKSKIDGLTIRKANENDVPEILSFIKALAEYEKMSDDVVATETSLKDTLFCEKPFATVIIAEYDNKPAGFALYFYNYSTFLAKPGIYLEDLFVYPEFRGKKIGKSLLANLANIAVQNNCGRLEWCVLNWNKPAIDFYQSIGAEFMDEWTTNRLTGSKLQSLAEESSKL